MNGRNGSRSKRGKPLQTAHKSSKSSISFDAFYEDAFGSERWKSLRKALVALPSKVAVWNKYCQLSCEDVAREHKLQVEQGIEEITVREGKSSAKLKLLKPLADSAASGSVDAAVEGGSLLLLDQPPRDDRGITAYYLLDPASAMIVEQLQVEGHHKVLDLCASPGGKSVCIGQFLTSVGELTSNEQKADRCARLRRNLEEHIPDNSFVWSVSQRDGTTWYNPCAYDRVLVDAPCSSERHVMHQPGGLATWSAATSHELSKLQTALLLRALEAAAVGGLVLYSTCSISPLENDGVVEDALRRTRVGVSVEPTVLPVGEATRQGWIVLPDVCANAGPMYCARLRKVTEQRVDESSSSESSDGD